jgi:hypothetical protein
VLNGPAEVLGFVETSFADLVLRWQAFASAAASCAATLVGLLFMSMSLRSQMATEDYAFERALWSLGTSAMVSFLDILLVALIVLIPAQTPFGLGGPMLGLAALAIGGTLLAGRATRAHSGMARRGRWTVGLALACYVIQGGIAVAVMAEGAGWLPWLAVLTGALLLNASFMAWELLRVPSLDRVGRTGRQAGQGATATIEGEARD